MYEGGVFEMKWICDDVAKADERDVIFLGTGKNRK